MPPAIPSVGINDGNVFDPGVVNIEAQAYPAPVDLAQALVRNLAALTPGLLFAPPLPPPDSQAIPRPLPVPVADQSFILPPLSLGVAVVDPPEVDVGTQNLIRQPVAEFVVTESGNFQFNRSVPQSVSFTIAAISSFTSQPVGGIVTTFYVITFAVGVNLMDFGVELTGTEASFPNSAPALNPDDVPTGIITKFTNRQIVVDGTDLVPAPVVGNTVVIDVSRHGDEVVFDIFSPDANVTIDAVQSASAAVTQTADARPEIDVFPDGINTFIGSGVRIPLLLYLDLRETAFFPADRPITTRGLPLNVNIG